MKFCTVHTHSLYCDGKNSLTEMADAAYLAGAVSFGASGHSPTHVPWDECGIRDLEGYRAEVLRLREAYAGRMDVLYGIELDSESDLSPEGFDYWIGSVHFLRDGAAGAYRAVDWDLPEFLSIRDTVYGGNIWAFIRGYYEAEAEMASRRPTVLGHIDLITKYNEGGGIFDEDDVRYRAPALEALHAADPSATLLEINTGAMARRYRTVPYPALFLLREWRAMGGRVILSADAHTADGIAYGYREAAELARAAGYREQVLLTRRDPVLAGLDS